MDITDEDLYVHYVMESLINFLWKRPELFDALADAWKNSNEDISLSDYIIWHCSDIIGIPDFKHFIEVEMYNVQIVAKLVEWIPDRWYKKLGLKKGDLTKIHVERCHYF